MDTLHFQNDKAILAGYLKTHSYGEYIFDWAWADFYQKNGLNYYPKLIHSTPFTPVNAPKILGDTNQFQSLVLEANNFVDSVKNISGEHYLFIDKEEAAFLESLSFKTYKTLQYHFTNSWGSFDEYLASLKSSRKKMIKKERNKVSSYGLEITSLEKDLITTEVLEEVYLLYLSTIAKKQAYAYLNQEFFSLLKLYMEDSLKIVVAKKNKMIIAMAIFFQKSDKLFGRYWGIHPNYEKSYPLLHFELCYYQGMDICFKNGLTLFEAGAQGEQKLWRGFKPEVIYSSHKLKHKYLRGPIYDFIHSQNIEAENLIDSLSKALPFK